MKWPICKHTYCCPASCFGNLQSKVSDKQFLEITQQWLTICTQYCCDRKSRAACVQGFALLQQAAIEFTCHDHSIIACSCHIYVWCSSRTSHSWWIAHSTQHHQRGCNNIPSFLQRTAPIARSLCGGWPWHDLHILVTARFCCDRKSERHVHKASQCGSKQK